MAEIDAEKKILEWCGHLSVPRWVDEKAYDKCKSCSGKMESMFKKDRHHCRLCGHMFCGACTAKYHVPLIFRIKNKDGPARVCFSCVDGCMAEKAKAEEESKRNPNEATKLTQSALATTTMSASLQSMAKAVEIAPPESWQEESAFCACPKCRATKVQSYNCRVCGLRYCDKCTSKMEVPACFERKAKTGPSRVCDPCRYKVVNGAKLVEKLSGVQGATKSLQAARTAVPPPPPGAAGSTPGAPGAGASGRRMSSIARGCTTIGCAALATAGPEGKCATHGGTAGAAPSSETRLQVKRASDSTVLAELLLPSPDTPLSTIDVLFKKTAPQAETYSFVFRGAPIPEAFYTVFFARHLAPAVFIQPRSLLKAKGSAGPSGASAAVAPDDAIGGANNPFRRDEAKEQAVLAQRTQGLKPPPEPKLVEFKKPPAAIVDRGAASLVAKNGAADSAQKAASSAANGSHVGGKKLPPPPPGSSAAANGAGGAAAALAANGGNVDDLLKQRAKALFN